MPGDLAPKATGHEQRVGGRKFSADDAFAVAVFDLRDLCKWTRLVGDAMRHFRALAVESE